VICITRQLKYLEEKSDSVYIEIVLLLLFTIFTFIVMRTRRLISRKEGAILLPYYIGYISFRLLN